MIYNLYYKINKELIMSSPTSFSDCSYLNEGVEVYSDDEGIELQDLDIKVDAISAKDAETSCFFDVPLDDVKVPLPPLKGSIQQKKEGFFASIFGKCIPKGINS